MRSVLVLFVFLLPICGFGPALALTADDATAAYSRGDYAAARRIARQLANEGNPSAMHLLGIMFRNGTGARKDAKEAAWWFFQAANTGYALAYYELAIAHDDGLGVGRDRRSAAEFMLESLMRGLDLAVKEMTTNSNAWSREFRRHLQIMLRKKGVYSGAIDGSFGPATKRAIKALKNLSRKREPGSASQDVQGERMIVAMPDLGIFPQPSIYPGRIGSLHKGDIVTVQHWQEKKGERWGKICRQEVCGWVAAEFLAAVSTRSDEFFIWSRAVNENSISTYREYLKQFPNGAWASDVKRRLRRLGSGPFEHDNEYVAWSNAVNANTVTAFLNYLRRHPEGLHAGDVRQRLRRLGTEPPPAPVEKLGVTLPTVNDLSPPQGVKTVTPELRPPLGLDDLEGLEKLE